MRLFDLLQRVGRAIAGERPPVGRDLQLRIDTAFLYKLCHQKNVIRGPVDPPCLQQSEIASIIGADSLPSFEYQARIVRNHLQRSAVKSLDILAQALQTAYRTDATAENNAQDIVRRKIGFYVDMAPSKAPAAGRGVFVKGRAPAGSLVTLYPGVSYLPSQLRSLPGFPNLNAVNDYFISRYDGVMIDGSAQIEMDISEFASVDCEKEADDTPEEGGDESGFIHPFALGHIVNHPPPESGPNVLQFMLDLDLRSVSRRALNLVPNENFEHSEQNRFVGRALESIENTAFRQRVPSTQSFSSSVKTCRTMAIIATRDIEDEEVYMNYRFNPHLENLPDWYHDCDPEASERRWKPKGVFG